MNIPRLNLRDILRTSLILSFFIVCMILLYALTKWSDWHDFDVFYQAASAALNNNSVYVVVGKYDLPFWYPPWIAWFFIPFAIFNKDVGLIFYQATTLACAVIVVCYLSRYYDRYFKFPNILVIISFLVPLSSQLISVGQMEYIFLFLIVVIIWAVDQKRDVLVGILYPFLWVKPHLLIPFSLYLFLRAGKRAVVISVLISTAMLIFETHLDPEWYLEIFNRFQESGSRTDGLAFTTFPSLLGFQENWLGTANIPMTLGLIIIAVVILWGYRKTPPVPFLSIALAASLFCAPRAYAYDLPLLIPAMIWLTAEKFQSRWWLWMVMCIFPTIVSFSTYSYIVVLFVFGFCIYNLVRGGNSANKFSLTEFTLKNLLGRIWCGRKAPAACSKKGDNSDGGCSNGR